MKYLFFEVEKKQNVMKPYLGEDYLVINFFFPINGAFLETILSNSGKYMLILFSILRKLSFLVVYPNFYEHRAGYTQSYAKLHNSVPNSKNRAQKSNTLKALGP